MGKRDQKIEASGWSVYPAIDLRQGRVVRLMQGDLALETHYAGDPVSVARRWKRAGAEWVHVVNLDGAFGEGGSENLATLEGILRSATDVHVQFGGGLRNMASIQRAMDLGVSRVVLGTAAVQSPSLVETALNALGTDRVAVGIDARNGVVQTHGWRQGAEVAALDLAKCWADRGIQWLIFTDVTRDGMGHGLNREATVRLAQVTGLNVIASGGVASLDDVQLAWEAGLSGVIIGRALYEGWVMLEDALRVPLTPAEP